MLSQHPDVRRYDSAQQADTTCKSEFGAGRQLSLAVVQGTAQPYGVMRRWRLLSKMGA